MDSRVCASAGLLLVVYYLATKKDRNQRLPPGPKPLPLIGNMLDMPTKKAWLTFAKWREQYGDIVYVKVLGQPIVVLNSIKVCDDLLEKRSSKYSDRPRFVMLTELMGWEYAFSLMPYSPRWRLHRRFFHQYFNETASREYESTHEKSANSLLRNLLKQPEKFRDHIRLLFAETIMEVVYGYQVKGHGDKFIKIAETAMHGFSVAAETGRFYVDIFPVLKALPSWMPGAGFKRQAAEWKKYILASRDEPASYVQQQMDSGTAQPSVLGSMLSKYGQEKDEDGSNINESNEDAAKGVCATTYAAGSDTTLAAFEAFFLAMANYPECQAAAQAELDGVIGDSRLPTFQDRKDLPYINATIKEILRWHVIVPTSVAHVLSEDDEYEGYLLTKGTIVLPNTWLYLRDPKIYPDPHTFNPSRWLIDTPEGKKLDETIPGPETGAFGYGRRVCPGRYFADGSLFMSVAAVLATFTIRPLDAKGMPSERCEEGTTDGVLVYPARYNVSIEPRSVKACQLINETE